MTQSVSVSGKFLRVGNGKFYVKGFSYGPFAPNRDGEPFPERQQLAADFRQIRGLGANTVRIYFPPPRWFMDAALEHGLKVFIDVPWEKHRCFFEDWQAQQRARDSVRITAKTYGHHPALLAISVANELPVDVVRFQGRRRVEQFLEELVAIVKEEAPRCLTTFVNFPTTEFLQVSGCDFHCFNVYVHDAARFGAYLDRLQHLAGNRPLILGEYGIDSQREGEEEQAAMLSRHLQQVFHHGLAGSFVFSFTDDWYTGGCQIEDWFFGVTRRDRSEKPAAAALRSLWRLMPFAPVHEQPKVSVVVCSYNGGQTLAECLHSLMRLDYPDYEVILIDDGSTDETPQIVAEFPSVVYHRQSNHGLSVARNVGAELATGEIVAYTDSDCVVDENWLFYLAHAMLDQQVEAIGGPNITPDSDGWIAKCVSASPGNPSHVMLDDRRAEHVPGCNMAFRRSTLIALGGFDAQFRAAGDDVDLCWRMLDAGLQIGYAPGAMVWHHRRTTIGAFAKQQKGYGRSEAMVHFKHPQRCGAFGRSSWRGIIYGDGAVGLPLQPDRIYHGRFGGGLFQTIYRHNDYGLWAILMSLEWHLGAIFILLLSLMFMPLALVSCLMWSATFVRGISSAWSAPLPAGIPSYYRVPVTYLYVMQPIWRGWNRLTYLLRNKRLPHLSRNESARQPILQRGSATTRNLYWDCRDGWGREELLHEIVRRAQSIGWAGDFDNAWSDWDVKLVGDRWHNITICTATEELGWPRRFTRARCSLQRTVFAHVLAAAGAVWCALAVATHQTWGLAVGLAASGLVLGSIAISRHRCLREATALVWQSAARSQPDSSPIGKDSDLTRDSEVDSNDRRVEIRMFQSESAPAAGWAGNRSESASGTDFPMPQKP